MLSLLLDSMILKVFSNLNYSMFYYSMKYWENTTILFSLFDKEQRSFLEAMNNFFLFPKCFFPIIVKLLRLETTILQGITGGESSRNSLLLSFFSYPLRYRPSYSSLTPPVTQTSPGSHNLCLTALALALCL